MLKALGPRPNAHRPRVDGHAQVVERLRRAQVGLVQVEYEPHRLRRLSDLVRMPQASRSRLSENQPVVEIHPDTDASPPQDDG